MKLRSVLVTSAATMLPAVPLLAQDMVNPGPRMQAGTGLAAIGFFVAVASYLAILYLLPKLLKSFI